jgi:hypothetical protein
MMFSLTLNLQLNPARTYSITDQLLRSMKSVIVQRRADVNVNLYSGDPWFEYRTGHRLSTLRYFVDFSDPLVEYRQSPSNSQGLIPAEFYPISCHRIIFPSTLHILSY